MMKQAFPVPDEHTLATLCGPKPMNKMVIQHYKDLGVPEANILKF
jgi:NAD(P)H-flavin reductase